MPEAQARAVISKSLRAGPGPLGTHLLPAALAHLLPSFILAAELWTYNANNYVPGTTGWIDSFDVNVNLGKEAVADKFGPW
jgi:hypothetical protein